MNRCEHCGGDDPDTPLFNFLSRLIDRFAGRATKLENQMADLATALSDLNAAVSAVTANDQAKDAAIADLTSKNAALQAEVDAGSQSTADAIEAQAVALQALVPAPAAPVEPAPSDGTADPNAPVA